MKRPNRIIIVIRKEKKPRSKAQKIFSKTITEENSPNLKKMRYLSGHKKHTKYQIHGTRKKIPMRHNNQSTRYTEQRKTIKDCKRKRPITYKGNC